MGKVKGKEVLEKKSKRGKIEREREKKKERLKIVCDS